MIIKSSDCTDSQGYIILEGDVLEFEGAEFEIIYEDGKFFAKNITDYYLLDDLESDSITIKYSLLGIDFSERI